MASNMSKEHVAMCAELHKIAESINEALVIATILTYKHSLHHLLSISSEPLIYSVPGATLVHFIFKFNMHTAYQTIMAIVGEVGTCDFLHRQSHNNIYPLELAPHGSDIIRYVKPSAGIILESVYMDMFRDKMLFSGIETHVYGSSMGSIGLSLLKLACIFGTRHSIERAVDVFAYSSRDYKDVIRKTYNMLTTLCRLGGNDPHPDMVCKDIQKTTQDIVADLKRGLLSSNPVPATLEKLFKSTDCPFMSQCGAPLLAMVRACKAISMEGRMDESMTAACLNAIKALKVNEVVFHNSLLQSVMSIDSKMSCPVSRLAYLILLKVCNISKLTEDLLDPLYEHFFSRQDNWTFVETEHLTHYLFMIFARIKVIRGEPLVSMWARRHRSSFTMNKALNFMLCSIGLMPISEVDDLLELHPDLSASNVNVIQSLKHIQSVSSASSSQCVNISCYASRVYTANSLRFHMDYLNKALNPGFSRMAVIAHCAHHMNSIEMCMDAMRMVGRIDPLDILVTIEGKDFTSLFFNRFLKGRQLSSQDFEVIFQTFRDVLFCKRSESIKSLHEMMCGDVNAAKYMSLMPEDVLKKAWCYSIITKVLLDRAIRIVDGTGDVRSTVDFLSSLSQRTVDPMGLNLEKRAFFCILLSIVQARIPTYNVKLTKDEKEMDQMIDRLISSSESGKRANIVHTGASSEIPFTLDMQCTMSKPTSLSSEREKMDYNVQSTLDLSKFNHLPQDSHVNTDFIIPAPFEFLQFPYLPSISGIFNNTSNLINTMFITLVMKQCKHLPSGSPPEVKLASIITEFERLESVINGPINSDVEMAKWVILLLIATTSAYSCVIDFGDDSLLESLYNKTGKILILQKSIPTFSDSEITYLDSYLFFLLRSTQCTQMRRQSRVMKFMRILFTTSVALFMDSRVHASPLLSYATIQDIPFNTDCASFSILAAASVFKIQGLVEDVADDPLLSSVINPWVNELSKLNSFDVSTLSMPFMYSSTESEYIKGFPNLHSVHARYLMGSI